MPRAVPKSNLLARREHCDCEKQVGTGETTDRQVLRLWCQNRPGQFRNHRRPGGSGDERMAGKHSGDSTAPE